ncbi:MAG: ComEC/Rec2 family competence protein, partial [Clostridia bacterium]|nr:ComEC/Rec2 family competence protein [Clostridia bacterium]
TYLAKRIDSANMDRTAPLVKALLLGETKGLDGMLKQDFRRLGISHILSISGTHFTTLLGMVALLLSMFGLNKRTIYIVLIPLALLYMGLTGFSAAVCRAGLMSILSYWGFLCGRTRDSYTALFVAVTVILLLAPYSVLSIGLWLSFTATFSILIFMDLFSTGRLSAMRASPPGKLLFLLLTHLVITVAVSFFTLPITAACFGEISIAAPFANLLIVPLFELFLYIAPFAAIFSNMGFLTDLTDAIGYHILFLTQRICETDELLLSVNHTFVILIATIGCACTLLLIALPLRRRGWIALPGCLSILCIGISILLYNHVHWKQTNITYFTVGESDGIVVTDQNKTLCIDISNGGSSAAYKAEYIASENHSPELGGYMFTHYHDLHVQQFLKLTNRTNVHTVYLPLSEKADDADKITSISEIAESRNIKVIRFAYGEPVRFADTTIILYAPQDIKRSTHEVIGLKIIAKNQEILYLGSSYYETNFALRDEIKNAAYIFFGQHAPIVKKPFAALTNAFQIYGSATLAAMSDQKRPDIILDKNGQYEIILK